MTEETKDLAKLEDGGFTKGLAIGNEFENMMKWSEMFAETKYYQQMTAQGGKFAILAIFAVARDLDIPYTSALNGGIYIVQGRVQLSSQMMNLMIRRKGHSVRKKIHTDEICHLVGTRADNGDTMESVFTIQHAEKAGLTKNPVWKSHTQRMLFNRALSNLAKDLFADCIGNALVEGEMDTIDVTTSVVEPEPMEKESALFIDKFGLLDLNCVASKFIDSISVNLGQTRTETIKQCSKEPEKFQKNLDRFVEKFKPQQKEE